MLCPFVYFVVVRYKCSVGQCHQSVEGIFGTVDELAHLCAFDPQCQAFEYLGDAGNLCKAALKKDVDSSHEIFKNSKFCLLEISTLSMIQPYVRSATI